MSTDTQLVDFARLVLNHPAKQKVIDRIDTKLLHQFRKGSPEVREECIKVLDSTDLFFAELRVVVDEALTLNEEDENGE